MWVLSLAGSCGAGRERGKLFTMARNFRNHLYHQLKCWACGHMFTSNRSDSKFCSTSCRQFGHREERAGRPWHFQFQVIMRVTADDPPQLSDGERDGPIGLA